MQWDKLGIVKSSIINWTEGERLDHPVSDDILLSENSTGKWLSIPISSEEVGIMRNLPRPARDAFQKNVHEYIGQVGKEHGAQPG